MKPKQNLVLASSSPYRKELLERLGLSFTCAAPDIDESPVAGETATELVMRLAEGKARALVSDFPDSLIIGSDQVAVLDEQILGKPGNIETAVTQLQNASGREVRFLTGLCLYNAAVDKATVLCEPFTVHFRSLSEACIRDYIERESPLNCAGSFKSEGLGIALFSRLEGDDPTALIGLPLIRLCSLLEQVGYPVLASSGQ